MNFRKLSEQIDEFIQQQGGYWDIPWLLSAITEEVGELSRALQIYSKVREERFEKESSNLLFIEEESGDVLFALICLANYFRIDLETAVLKTLNKYKNR